MTKEEFRVWIASDVKRNPVNPYDDWVHRTAFSIFREEPFDEEKADAFVKMIKYGFALGLYFFVEQ